MPKLVIGVKAHKYIKEIRKSYVRPLLSSDIAYVINKPHAPEQKEKTVGITDHERLNAFVVCNENGEQLMTKDETRLIEFNGKYYVTWKYDKRDAYSGVTVEPIKFPNYLESQGLILGPGGSLSYVDDETVIGIPLKIGSGLGPNEILKCFEKAEEKLRVVGIKEKPLLYKFNKWEEI